MPSKCPFPKYLLSVGLCLEVLLLEIKKGAGIQVLIMGWNTFEVFFASPVYPELSKFRIHKIKSVCLFQPLPLSISVKDSLFMGSVKNGASKVYPDMDKVDLHEVS